MEKKNILNIVSQHFPYGLDEQFFEKEVWEMATFYDEIVLFPLEKVDGIRDLPANVKVNDALNKVGEKSSIKDVLANIGLIIGVVGFELKHSNKKWFILSKLKWWMSRIGYSKRLGSAYLSELDLNQNNHHYSFWMNDAALMLSLLRLKKKIVHFDFRVNGFDIFAERHAGQYMPFRYFNYSLVRHIYVLSKAGLSYIEKLNWKKEKLIYAPYGIYAQGLNRLKEESQFRIVSCANMIALKRIDKIIAALNLIQDKTIHWVHFGDGLLKTDLEKQAEQLPSNILVDFRGHTPNQNVIDFYQNESVNLFIHTSETEGLGMAIIEAQSFGIPAVVIGVGGVLDIVTDKTGIILQPSAAGPEIAAAIHEVLDSEKNTQAYRDIIQKECLNVFDASTNYEALYEIMNKK